MEGTFVTPGANWSLIWVAIGFGIAFAVLILTVVIVDRSMRNHQDKASSTEGTRFFLFLAVAMFIGSIISLSAGLFPAGEESLNSVDCFDTKYATEGVYVIKDAKLVFSNRFVYGKGKEPGYYIPDRPAYFAMHLEGKVENDSATKAVVCIRVLYDRVWETYPYIPSLEGIISEKPIGGFTIPIDLPQYAIKSNGNWWIFSDAVPAQ